MLRRTLARRRPRAAAITLAALALTGCPGTEPPPPVFDVPPGYTGPVTLTVENHATATSVVSIPAGIDCPKTCMADFDVGSTIELTLASHGSYFLALYSKPCEKVDGDDFSCRVTLTGTTTITAEGAQEIR